MSLDIERECVVVEGNPTNPEKCLLHALIKDVCSSFTYMI
jgi:hypothetical protein